MSVGTIGVIRDVHFALDSSDLPQAEARPVKMFEKLKNATQTRLLIEGRPHRGLTVFKLLECLRRRLQTSNICERIDREINRGTYIAGVFLNKPSVLRLFTVTFMEAFDEWETGCGFKSDSLQF